MVAWMNPKHFLSLNEIFNWRHDIKHNDTQCDDTQYTAKRNNTKLAFHGLCHYIKCRYAECRGTLSLAA